MTQNNTSIYQLSRYYPHIVQSIEILHFAHEFDLHLSIVTKLFYFESSLYEYKTGKGTSGLIPNTVRLSEMFPVS